MKSIRPSPICLPRHSTPAFRPLLPPSAPALRRPATTTSSTMYVPVTDYALNAWDKNPKPFDNFPYFISRVTPRYVFPPLDAARIAGRRRRRANRIQGWKGVAELLYLAKASRQRTSPSASDPVSRGRQPHRELLQLIRDAADGIEAQGSVPRKHQLFSSLYRSIADRFDPNSEHHDRSLPAPLYPAATAWILRSCQEVSLAEKILEQYVHDARALIEAGQTHRLLSSLPFAAMVQSYDQLWVSDRFDAVLMQLRDSGLRPSHAMASHLVRNCSADDVIFVETCLSQLQEASLRPSLKLLNTLLGFYIQRQDQEAVSRTYARIMALYPAESSPRDSKVGVRRHRRGPNADTAALLFSNGTTLSYISECYKAIQAWKNNTLSSERAQTGLFQALDKIAPIQSKASVALEWMNRLEQDGYRPTRGALDAVVTSFLRQGRIADAFRLIARLRQLRAHQTSSAVTTQLLQAVGVPRAGGQAAGSEAIWQQLHHHVEQQKPLSAKMFRSIVSAMGRTGEVRGLWFLFNLLGRKAGTYESRTLVESGPASRGDFGSIALSSGPLDPRPTHPSPEDLSHNRVLVASVDPESGSVLHHLLCSMGKIRHGSTDETIALFRALPATHQRPLSYSLLRSIRRRKTQHQSFIDIVSTWFQQGTVELEPKKLAQELEDMVRRILKHEADPASPQQASRSMSHSTPAGLSKIHAWNKSWENDDSMIEAVQRASTAALAKVVCENLRRVRSGEDVAYALEELQSCRLFHA